MAINTWKRATYNWHKYCLDMGCKEVSISGAFANTYPIYRTGPLYNFVIVQDPNIFSISETEKTFNKIGKPFTIKIPKLTKFNNIEETMKTLGFSLIRVWKIMTIDKIISEVKNNIKVEKINVSSFDEWFETLNSSNHQSKLAHIRYDRIKKALQKGSTHLFMASINDNPVGTALVFSKKGTSSIHMMKTKIKYRRKGVASTLLIFLFYRIKKEKSELIWLRTQKSGIGEKVYDKIGFKSSIDILSFTKTPYFEDRMLNIFQKRVFNSYIDFIKAGTEGLKN